MGKCGEAAEPDGGEHFRMLVSGVTEYAIFMLDAQGYVTNWNTGAERIKGYRPDEIVGQHFSIFYTDEDRAAGVPAAVLQTAARQGMYEAQAWRVRKGGKRFMANVLVQPVYDPAGHLVGFLKLTRDVSERFRQQKALEETRAALARSRRQAAEGEVRRIAHDLNNVLQSIRNGAELLRHVYAADSEGGRLVDMVRRNTDSAANLTAQLMTIAHKPGDLASAINVNELVAGMVELLRQLLGEHVTIETILGGGLWCVEADPDQLKIAILNLVVNGRNALPRGGKLTVETANVVLEQAGPALCGTAASGEYVVITVTDTGPGMTSEMIARAFGSSTDRAGDDGIGLGLSQVAAFIGQTGGHAGCDTAPQQGTSIRLYLPRLVDTARLPELAEDGGAGGAGTEHSTSRPLPDSGDVLAGLRVLVVEDESLVAMLVEDLLDQLGCTVVDIVSSLDDGLDGAMQGAPDIALLDVNIGGQPVYPVADALQARGVAFVFMSGNQRVDEPWRKHPVLQKPFALDDLRRALQQAVRVRSG